MIPMKISNFSKNAFAILCVFGTALQAHASSAFDTDQESINSRNEQRAATLNSLSNVVELYYQDNTSYPATKLEFANALRDYGSWDLSEKINDPLLSLR